MSVVEDRSSVGTLRVLVVDDDAEQRALVRRLLVDAGFRTIGEASDGTSALAVAGDDEFDLILLDLVMPGRSGIELLPELQERAGPGARIVVLSNLPRRMLDEIVRQRGAVGFVEKRVPPAELVPEILTAAAMTDLATEHMSLRLGGTTGAAGDARRFVRDRLLAVSEEVLSSIELLVSELVTNAVLHASTAPRLAIRLNRSTVRVEVYDDDPSIPRPLPLDSERIGGRGLYIVDAMSERWGAEASGEGKVVWFELARG